MYARVTLLEVDTERVPVHDALETYERAVLPDVRAQPGFRGCYVLSTTEGKGLILTFWDTEEQAAATGESGFYPDVLRQYVTLFRSPPGRERYEVLLAAEPVPAT